MSSQIKRISLPFIVVDVFTDTAFSGNPLAIVRLPSSNGFAPRQAQLQAIATEFNLSETIFLEQQTEQDTNSQVCRARIFTTSREILFAGHPTIGATTWLLHYNPPTRNVKTLIPGAGPIPIKTVPSMPGHVSAVAPHTFHQHVKRLSVKQLLAIHQSLDPHVEKNATFPIVSIVHGMTWALVELASLEALASAKLPNSSANISANSDILDQGWRYDSVIGVYLFVRNAEPERSGVETIRTRMLIRNIEDPATGSAASALTGYLAKKEAAEKGTTRNWKIVQGVEMGRRSEIGITVTPKGTDDINIEISGTAIVVTDGVIHLPINDNDRSSRL